MSLTKTLTLPNVERLFDGRPLISPQGDSWESGVTFNTAAVFLKVGEHSETIRQLLGPDEELRDIVALHYRARPESDPGFQFTRSYVGLSLHEPDLTLIKRFENPVVSPEAGIDENGVEDPRVAWVDGCWWMVYCGVSTVENPDPNHRWLATVCAAKSDDLMTWTKVGALEGFAGRGLIPHGNKDGVLFPERIEGKVVMLHRPLSGDIDTWQTAIAVADLPEGPFIDLGNVHGPERHEDYLKSWVGAGAVPIRIGKGRYLSIEHTGNYLPGMKRKYVLDAFLYDFNDWDPTHPQSLVKARIDDFMRPETDFEINGPFPESVANVVFACGAYVHDGWIYIVYGGGDSYILAARVRYDELVAELMYREQAAKEAVAT